MEDSIMKKTYKNPELQVVKIQTQQMLASSPGYGNNTTETSGNLVRESYGWWDDAE